MNFQVQTKISPILLRLYRKMLKINTTNTKHSPYLTKIALFLQAMLIPFNLLYKIVKTSIKQYKVIQE